MLTLDYELFFGKQTGTPQACMIKGCDALLKVLENHSASAVFFVDASYLVRLREYSRRSVKLARDYSDVVSHIRQLEACGHQIQLHIHPHWFDSWHDGGRWHMVTDRYRLAQWSRQDIASLVTRCVRELNSHLTRKVFVFRAGGWCVQPFSSIADALCTNGIRVDSSVFHGGAAESEVHRFDFRSAPRRCCWRFDTDPCQPEPNGAFTEMAISSQYVSPLFYWRFALVRLFGQANRHTRFGDGSPIENGRRDLLHLLTHYSHMAVSIDGYKATLLRRAFQQAKKHQHTHFVAMGHPKSLTPFGLEHLSSWLDEVYSNGGQLEGYPQPKINTHAPAPALADG
ncbi:polysaccharide deacetylase family protein [Microbulbifer pacificus]|uniref:NodB homology domain-containing protein n=1 Tax=Microbulbifer pacificus TaxID=407164 RepID=A0AAU0N473_9GAMM|nr:hypothetical protein [Microbulbifer pacificus]WOX06728.1 hypothetical protein R5R33_06250 [Microbulbifer pacificus]